MPKQTVIFHSLNRGEVSRLALMRVDVEKLRLAADTMINWFPHVAGPMTFRPGTQYVGGIKDDLSCKFLEFVYDVDDTALIELTDSAMRIWVDDALVTRVATSTTIQALTVWTPNASTGATINQPSYISIFNVSPGATSSVSGTITVSAGDYGKEQGLRIVISQGPINFRIGTTLGDEDVLKTTSLGAGTHSLAFTLPSAGTLYAQFDSQSLAPRQIDSVDIEAAGVVELPTPWLSTDLSSISYDQSADIIFVACAGRKQIQIERHSTNGWSVVDYLTADGPFPAAEGNKAFKFTPNTYQGAVTLTCNKPFFTSDHLGALIRLFHTTQTVSNDLNVADTYTNAIRVSGTNAKDSGGVSGNDRNVNLTITGTWSGKVTVERTFDTEGKVDWAPYKTYTTNTTVTLNDALENVICYYRIGFAPGDYTSGTATVTLGYNGGGGYGIGRIYYIDSSTQAHVEALTPFLSVHASENWRLSEWGYSSTLNLPSAVALHEGRLWWGGANRIWGSVSDGYWSYNFAATGDSAPISRSIGKGPIAKARWLLSLNRLVLGLDAGVMAARSNSFDDILTPTVFNMKYSSTQGAQALRPLQVDTKGVFVQRSGRRVYMMTFSSQAFDYKLGDLTRLNPDIGVPGFVDSAVQRQYDTRLWFVRGDGTAAVLVYDEDDEVIAWCRVETDGDIENVVVLPGELEDRVYVVVKRTIDGGAKRYLERFVRMDECYGETTSKLADCHAVYSGASTSTITGLDHLEGREVVVWGDGKDLGTYTVASGSITLSQAVENAVVGLSYEATFISAKLAYAAAGGSAINKPKRISQLGIVLDRTHYQGVQIGQYDKSTGAGTLDKMPLVEKGVAVAADTIYQEYDQQNFPINGDWDADSRLYIKAASPRPATVMGVTFGIETNG